MDPVSNTDRLVRLLRQQLEQRSRSKRTQKTQTSEPVRQDGVERLRAVAGEVTEAGGQDHQLRRLLVEQLLSNQFGSQFVNEPRFQQIVDQVAETMAADPWIYDLLNQTIGELRARGI